MCCDTIGDYIIQKLSVFGDITEADITDFELKSGVSKDDLISLDNIDQVEIGMIKIIPSLLGKYSSVSENGFSVVKDMEGLLSFYKSLCRSHNIIPDSVDGIGVVSSYNDF